MKEPGKPGFFFTGTVRTPIDPSLVKVYSTAPPEYEEIAVIDATSRSSFSFGDQKKMDAVIERLKKEAASLGANGVLPHAHLRGRAARFTAHYPDGREEILPSVPKYDFKTNVGWFRYRAAEDGDRAKTAKFNPDQLTKQTNILWSYTGGALRMELSPKGGNMSGHGSKKKLDGSARPIKTKRDFAGAQIVVKKIGDQTEPETAAEARMQSLVKAMEKFDSDEDESGDELGEDGYAGPRRRWSDDATDTDLD